MGRATDQVGLLQAMPPSLVEDRLDWLLISSDEQVPPVAAAAGRMGRKEEAMSARMARIFIFVSFGSVTAPAATLQLHNVASDLSDAWPGS